MLFTLVLKIQNLNQNYLTKMNKLISMFIVVLFMISSCNSHDCNNITEGFISYKETLDFIHSTSFKFKDNVDTARSSFIRNASFYSCSSKTGFLLVKIRSTEYIYQNVPIAVWEGFKNADSFGRFYNRNIKGKYQFKLEN
jgi:hypothetical protein